MNTNKSVLALSAFVILLSGVMMAHKFLFLGLLALATWLLAFIAPEIRDAAVEAINSIKASLVPSGGTNDPVVDDDLSASLIPSGGTNDPVVDDDEVVGDPSRKLFAAATPASRGTKSVSFASAAEASKPSPSFPSDQAASKKDVLAFAEWFEEKRKEDAERQDQCRREELDYQEQRRQKDQERFERAEENQLAMMSKMNEHGTKIGQHGILLEDHGEKIAQNATDIYDLRSQTQKNAIAILGTPRMVQKAAKKVAKEYIALDRAKRRAAKKMGLPSPDSSLSPASSSSSSLSSLSSLRDLPDESFKK